MATYLRKSITQVLPSGKRVRHVLVTEQVVCRVSITLRNSAPRDARKAFWHFVARNGIHCTSVTVSAVGYHKRTKGKGKRAIVVSSLETHSFNGPRGILAELVRRFPTYVYAWNDSEVTPPCPIDRCTLGSKPQAMPSKSSKRGSALPTLGEVREREASQRLGEALAQRPKGADKRLPVPPQANAIEDTCVSALVSVKGMPTVCDGSHI